MVEIVGNDSEMYFFVSFPCGWNVLIGLGMFRKKRGKKNQKQSNDEE